MVDTPRWAELIVLMQSRSIGSARGSYRFVEGESAPKRERGKVLTCDFAYRAPDCWRVEHDGKPYRLSDGKRTLIWRGRGRKPVLAPANTSYGFYRDPSQLLLGTDAHRWTRDDDYAKPSQRIEAATFLDRPAWRVLLTPPPHKSGDLELIIDAATGIELRIANASHGSVEELTALEVDVNLDDSVFSYDGPVDDSEARERAREIQATDYWHRHLPPLPTYWPTGLGHHINSGDVETGWLVMELDIPHQSPVHCAWAQLVRGPKGSELNLGYKRPESMVHRWETEQWQWALLLAPPGLDEEELAKVVASIRDA